ncbi:SGNH/GDSL hydrolase family protein [Peribacillus glennii]|uniref:Hydrolase n=1 Tax=Peribacillus glennii TaxID=2303991 RepID=A0A372LGD0_9BACI|nr:SGNH/GDSL hydrolase family protein [Peribacillus glennii]RFU65337.1 hydrolase [Peribacillus glennii]
MKILFIGDSITDAGRRDDPEGFGYGYVRMIRDHYMLEEPAAYPNIVNKGIAGNRITDLEARWQKDVLDENPDVISISIGINDVWRQLDQPQIEQVYPLQYASVFRSLLSQAAIHTKAQIVLMEPTILEENHESEGNKRLLPYVEIVKNMAVQYNAALVPEHSVFIEALKRKSGFSLTTDGVHLSSTGHLLMAKTWMKHAGVFP